MNCWYFKEHIQVSVSQWWSDFIQSQQSMWGCGSLLHFPQPSTHNCPANGYLQIMQNIFSTNYCDVFMPFPDLQAYLVNQVQNPQRAQINKAISIAQFILSEFPHESLRSCLLEFSYLSLFARYDSVPVFPLNTGSVNSDTCRNSMYAFGPF